MEPNPAAKAALLATVANQIKGEDSPEVRAEYERLLREEFTETEARELIVFVLGCHLVKTLKTKLPFDYTEYVSDLQRLPDCDIEPDVSS